MAKAKKQPQTRVAAELPGGFRDYGPADAIARQKILEKVRKTFEDFGFDPMETPAVERTEVLTGGEKESQKIIFNVRGSREKESDSSLRFDLTVPLARFLAANPEIPKPFKRYQIGNSWRGESPQAGRYREFMQADVDIVGTSSPEADSEVITVIYSALRNLGLERFIINIGNRKILNGLPNFAKFPEQKFFPVLRAIDKTDKIGKEEVRKELEKLVGKKPTAKIFEFLSLSGDARTKLQGARKLLGEIAISEEGIRDLEEIAENLAIFGVNPVNWQFNFYTVRGLGYYTGTVFETYLNDLPEIGSVTGGGRYDDLLIPFTGQKIPAVGTSIGIDRLFTALGKLGITKKKVTSTRVLIFNLSLRLKTEYLGLAKILREANINTAVYLGDDRAFQAQLAYAVKKEIPYLVIYGEEEKRKGVVTVRNMVTREQKEIAKKDLADYLK